MPQELATIDQNSLALATELAKSDLLPPHLKGKPANVMLLLGLANELGVSPMMAFNKVAVINGRPAMSSELMLALLNRSGKIRGTVQYEWIGKEGTPERGCIARATCAFTGATVEGQPVTLALAQSSGWLRNPLWKSMPDVMLRHRAAAWMVRQYWPDVLMGLQEEHEVRDIEGDGVTPSTRPPTARERLRAMRDVTPQESPGTTPENAADSEPHNTGNDATSESAASEDSVLMDFLTGAAEATEAHELTDMAHQCDEFEGAAKMTAKKAVHERALSLGFRWDKGAAAYVEGGAA